MRCDPEPGHPGYTGPAQIMKSPSGHTRQLIQPAFGSTESGERLGSEQREDIQPCLLCAFDHGHRLLGQMHNMNLGVLGPCFGQRPNLAREVEFLPLQAGNLFAPLSAERQALNDPAVRPPEFSTPHAHTATPPFLYPPRPSPPLP